VGDAAIVPASQARDVVAAAAAHADDRDVEPFVGAARLGLGRLRLLASVGFFGEVAGGNQRRETGRLLQKVTTIEK
jgi:hypothetical protein